MSAEAPASKQFTDRALGWIQDQLDGFEPFRGGRKPDETRQKALVELALLCLCLQRKRAYSGDPRVLHFLQFIERTCRTPFYRECLFRVPDAFVPHVLLAVILRLCGLDSSGDARVTQDLIDRSNITWTERVPHRALELRHLLDLGGFKHRMPSYGELYRRSLLAQPVNILYATDEDVYSITHTLFYLGDFGAKPISCLSPAHSDHALWVVEHLLGMYAHSGNWDLVGELLLSCHCLRHTTSDLYTLGWRALMSAQWPDGMVPGPYYDHDTAERLYGQHREEYVFKNCYHTTLVASLAGALCSWRGGDDEA